MTSNHNEDYGRCLESLIEVFLYLDGSVDEKRAREIDRHLEHCTKCYGRVEFERIVKKYVKKKVGFDMPTESMTDRVKAILD